MLCEREKLCIDDLQNKYKSFQYHCHQSRRQMQSSSEFEEFINIWKEYFLESFTKIFTDSSFFKDYNDLFVKHNILYNCDSKEGLTYNYCDTDKVDFEKHGLVYLRNANDCRIYDYAVFEAENCNNLKIFGNTKGKISGTNSTIIAKNRSRVEAIDIEYAEIHHEVYLIATNVKHIVCRNKSVVNIYSVPTDGMTVELYNDSVIICNDFRENIKIIRENLDAKS